MRRVSSGYTIVEVTIFLAISLVIATASMRLISGQQAETDFNQKMRDTQSKIQDWINDVSTGNTGGDPQNQHCSISSNRPSIQGGPSTTPKCVFLGKAIQFTIQPDANSDKLYAYTVFGCRAVGCPPSPTSTDILPTTVADSNPKAADGISSLNLTETFDLSPLEVKKVCSDGDPPCSAHSQLIGFYNSLNTQNASTSNGAEDINVYTFNLNFNQIVNSTPVDDCLQFTITKPPCYLASGNPLPLTSYAVCFTDGSRYAEITITSAAGIGASTDLVYKPC